MQFHIYGDNVIPSCDKTRMKQYKGRLLEIYDYNDCIV